MKQMMFSWLKRFSKQRQMKAVILIFAYIIFFNLPSIVEGQIDGESLFEQKCTGCHTIGGGDMIGPDLGNVTERRERDWLIRYSRQATDMKAAGDPIAVELDQAWAVAMPNIDITEAEAAAIVDFLASGEEQGPTQEQQKTLGDGDPNLGKKLFTGEIHFARGGGPCIGCHDAAKIGLLGGGSFGKDLTDVYTNYGENGLTTALLATPSPFPTMQPIYDTRPLREEEVTHLKAFFKDIAGLQSTDASLEINLLSFGGAALLFVAGGLIWKKRLRGVRRSLLEKHKKKQRS